MSDKEIIFNVKNETSGITFVARIIEPNQKYGRELCLTNDSNRNMLEFYDSRYPHDKNTEDTMLGQFVSRYYMETIVDRHETFAQHGLDLHGGVPSWKIDASGMTSLIEKLKYLGYLDNPEILQSEDETVKVSFTEWFFTNSGDRDFAHCDFDVRKYKVYEFCDQLEADKNISDVSVEFVETNATPQPL